MFRKTYPLAPACPGLAQLRAAAPARAQNPAAVLRPDPTNRQYFYYANKTQAMVGTSGSYLPDVNQNSASFNLNNTYCTLANFRACVNEIRSKGVNKIRLRVGLNHSPGTPKTASAPTPYPNEQPFVFNGSQWDLALFDNTNNPDTNDFNDGFFANIRKAIAYCNVATAELQPDAEDALSWSNSPAEIAPNVQSHPFRGDAVLRLTRLSTCL